MTAFETRTERETLENEIRDTRSALDSAEFDYLHEDLDTDDMVALGEEIAGYEQDLKTLEARLAALLETETSRYGAAE